MKILRQFFLQKFFMFRRDTAGAVAVMFGLAVLVIFVTAGGALDFGLANSKRNRLQAAADASALAAV